MTLHSMTLPNIPAFVAAYAGENGCAPEPTALIETVTVTGIDVGIFSGVCIRIGCGLVLTPIV